MNGYDVLYDGFAGTYTSIAKMLAHILEDL